MGYPISSTSSCCTCIPLYKCLYDYPSDQEPQSEADKTFKEDTQDLEKNKFQLELLQRALQVGSPEHRAQSLRMLVDMGLLNVKEPMIVEFTKNPNLVPQWPSESTGKAPSPASGGEKSSTPK